MEFEDAAQESSIVTREDLDACCLGTSGLRSVPYIILSDTGMTDICALHLSFILANHHLPDHLLRPKTAVKAGQHPNQIVAHDEHTKCQGIVYHPNEKLGNAGMKVLELADRLRASASSSSELGEADSSPSPSEMSISRRKTCASIMEATSNTVTKRRRSVAHPGSLDRSGVAADLDSARARVQGDTLQQVGPWSNTLWWAALRMLAFSRDIQPQSCRDSSSTPQALRAKPTIIKTLTISATPHQKKLKPMNAAKPLMSERDPNQRLNPWNIDFQKGSILNPPNSHHVSKKPPNRGIGGDQDSSKHMNPVGAAKQYRTKLPFGLPEDSWRRIAAHCTGVIGILSERQQISVLRWAMDRKTLGKERDALGLTQAAQIWRILEGTGCLAYDMEE